MLGPTLGPLFGGLVVQHLGWRWIFWIQLIVCFINTAVGFVFLKESYAPTILQMRKRSLEKQDGGDENQKSTSRAKHANDTARMNGNNAVDSEAQPLLKSKKVYRVANEDTRPISTKLAHSMFRPIKILFTQPIVLTMAAYQAILFGTVYSLFTNFEPIFTSIYGFDTTQVGLAYLGPGVGFLLAVLLIVPRIDTVYNALTARNKGVSQPEFRLPLANIGAVSIPVSLFWFGWTVQAGVHWMVPIIGTVFFGLGMICVMNTVQNYYIDSFSSYAASAIAAGAVFRSLVGGVVPLGATGLFEQVGYGWGMSVFAFLSLAVSPAPLIFYYFGKRVRERFAIDL